MIKLRLFSVQIYNSVANKSMVKTSDGKLSLYSSININMFNLNCV